MTRDGETPFEHESKDLNPLFLIIFMFMTTSWKLLEWYKQYIPSGG